MEGICGGDKTLGNRNLLVKVIELQKYGKSCKGERNLGIWKAQVIVKHDFEEFKRAGVGKDET